MRRSHPFLPEDLESLDATFKLAKAVVPMREIAEGNDDPLVIGLRHDVDDNGDSFGTALKLAEWEAERGYRSTYYLLHSAQYWNPGGRQFVSTIQRMLTLGHEVGIHVNALAEAIRQRRDPHEILSEAIHELRQAGAIVVGSVGHGDELCRDKTGGYRFVNDEMFMECARREMGPPDRVIKGTDLRLEPRSLAEYGLEYDSNQLPRKFYASDSGGTWNKPWGEVEAEALSEEGQLHILLHPDWWGRAFDG